MANNELKILCVFCNAIWTAEMVIEMELISQGCPSCGYGGTAEGVATITCNNCDRVVYKKEFTEE